MPRRLLGAALLLGVVCLGAAPVSPSPIASPDATAPAEARPAFYFLPESRLEVLTRRSGFLSFLLGDDLRIRAGEFEGVVIYDPGLPRRGAVDVRVPVRGLRVVTPADSADRAEIRRRMLQDVFEVSDHPDILFQSTRVEPVAGTLLVEGFLTMAGTARQVVVGMTTQVRGDTLLAQGRFSVRLSDFDMDRPGVAWGVVKVADQVDIDIYVRALTGTDAPVRARVER